MKEYDHLKIIILHSLYTNKCPDPDIINSCQMIYFLNVFQPDFSLLLLPEKTIFSGVYDSKHNGDLSQTPPLCIISTAKTQVYITLISCLGHWNKHSADSPVVALVRSLVIFHNVAREIHVRFKSNGSFNFSS